MPVIYLALFAGLYSSVTDSRPVLSILDMMRSDSATKIIDFSSDEEKSSKPKQNQNLIKIEILIMETYMFTPSILLMLTYLVLQLLQMTLIGMLKEMALLIPWDMR